jgi:hypothetical protein
MKKRILLQGIVVGVFAITAFTGCTAKGPKFEKFEKPKENKSLVYLFRTGIMGAAITPTITQKNLDTNLSISLGNIKPMGYIKAEVDEGNYEFWAKTEAKNEVNLKIEKGKTYCIEHYITIGFFIGHPQFKVVDMEQCKQDIKETHLSLED